MSALAAMQDLRLSDGRHLDVILEKTEHMADGVLRLTLRNPDGSDFPQWHAGSHIDLVLPNHTRQYSLCSPMADRAKLQIAVLLEPESRGGSAYVHTQLTPGSPLQISAPRNNFPLIDSRKYLFIAGGIGITPILPMIEQAEAMGREWRLAYGGRSRSSMAFLDELVEAYGDKILVYARDEAGRIDLEGLLGIPRAKMLVYACGPAPLLAGIEDYCLGWPNGALHIERFVAGNLDGAGGAEPFEVELANTGVTVQVPVGRTILEAVEEIGVRVLSSCRAGVCGTCEMSVLRGEVEHRDAVLTDDDRANADTMMICVSRAAAGCSKLTLDL